MLSMKLNKEFRQNGILKSFEEIMISFKENVEETLLKPSKYDEMKKRFDKQSLYKQFSNIACGDSVSTKLALMGIDKTNCGINVIKGKLEKYEEVIYRVEHLRWNAYCYCYGWRKLSTDDIIKRNDLMKVDFKKDLGVINNEEFSYLIHQDEKSKQHGSLVDWEELDTVSRITNHSEKYFNEYDIFITKSMSELVNFIGFKGENIVINNTPSRPIQTLPIEKMFLKKEKVTNDELIEKIF